jgi:penicillin-binding protein 1C
VTPVARARRAAGRVALASGLALAGALFALVVLDGRFPFPFERLEPEPATLVLDRDGRLLRAFLPGDDTWRLPVGLDSVAPELRRAVVASEDRWLHVHPGVNPLAVLRAAWGHLRAGRVVSGASTLAMQVARMLEPRPRSLSAKLVEAFRALQLRARLGPDAILEHWLELAPFGGNLQGVGAAAHFYFDKAPDALSVGEAALLVALPRAPAAYDPLRHPGAARRARDRVLGQLAARGVFSRERVAAARRQPLPTSRRPAPFAAPHFAEFAAARARGSHRLETTLDAGVQRSVEGLTGSRIAALRDEGIGNAAVVVIDVETRELLAMLGSADFFDPERPGQVNGSLARRSPGSALKPFLYASAFDAGLALPDAWLLDVPTDFAGYVPENYDGTYRGRMTAREALVESRNAPAVRLLARVGLPAFLAVLRRGGLATLDRPARDYGLPLVLGGGEVRLLDLANLYATLARGGLHGPVRWQRGPGPVQEERLWSPEAARWIAGILTQLRRPDFPQAWDLARDVPAVAWKTGTSSGHRDAWAVGFSARLAIGVWVGNLDGRARTGISGATHAAPLLFDLFRALEPTGSRLPELAAPRVARLDVCAHSRELPGPFCPSRVAIETLPGVSRLRPCRAHRRAFVDDETGLRVAGDCLARRGHSARIFALFPPELTAWWQARGRAVEILPPLHPSCRGVAGAAPHIVSPSAQTPYRTRRDAPAAFQKVELAARVPAGTRALYWYLDGRLLASAAPHVRTFVPLESGDHRLVVVDDAGRSDALHFVVE